MDVLGTQTRLSTVVAQVLDAGMTTQNELMNENPQE